MSCKKNFIAVVLFIQSFFFSGCILADGFVTGTLVKTPNGYIPIEQLQENDLVVSYNFQNKSLVQNKIIKIQKHLVDTIIQVFVNNHVIESHLEHMLFCPHDEHGWVKAKNLTVNHSLQAGVLKDAMITVVNVIKKRAELYSLSVQNDHTFFVSTQDILAHNFALPVIGAVIAWICTNLEISIGITLGGIMIAKGLTNKEADAKAKEWGYTETKDGKFGSHGQKRYKKGNSIISPDTDGHSGGVWKEYDRKGNRVGTLDENGNRIKD